jgi:flagella basal body P-ring formation protein FlgA
MLRRAAVKISIMIGLVVIFMGLTAWDDLPEGMEVYLKHVCRVSGNQLTLRDVVQSAAGKNYSLDFAAVRLPATSGRLVILSPEYIREALRSSYNGSLFLIGQGVYILPADAVTADSVWFYEALLDHIASRFSSSSTRIEAEIIGTPPIPDSQEGKPVFSMGTGTLRSGVMTGPVTINYRTNGVSPTAGAISLVLHVFLPVAVPHAAIRGGERFSDDALSARTIDVGGYSDALLLLKNATGTYTAATTLQANEPIALNKISRALFVRSGDKVAITFVNKNITVSLSGRALASGSLDDRIEVRPDTSPRRFTGLVIGDKEVLIDLQ